VTRLPVLAAACASTLLAASAFVPSALAAPPLGETEAPSAAVTTVDSGADLSPSSDPGYYQVRRQPLAAGRRALTVYFMPRGTAEQAPPEIQRLKAYQDTRDAAADTDVTFYGDGAVGLAAAAADDCSADYVCLYSLTDYGGGLRQFSANRWQNLGDFGFNDTTASVKNRRDWDALLAEDSNGNGAWRCFDSHSATSTLGSFNNRASSVFVSALDSRC
jgi:hypothetical protein